MIVDFLSLTVLEKELDTCLEYIVGELQGAQKHYRYLIVVQDLNSKWPNISPTSHTETSRIIKFWKKFLFVGICHLLLSQVTDLNLFQDNLSPFLKK